MIKSKQIVRYIVRDLIEHNRLKRLIDIPNALDRSLVAQINYESSLIILLSIIRE